MALDNNSLFTAARGDIYVGPVGTTAPTPQDISAFTPAVGLSLPWDHIGHTSRENLPEFGFEGGDTETRGTWQNEALREVTTEPAVDYVTFQLHQFDRRGLSLYYGADNDPLALPGEFLVMGSPTSGTELALCMVITDGDAKIAFYARKVSIRREDAIQMSVDEFAALPLRATFLKDGSHELYRWISEDIAVNPDDESS